MSETFVAASSAGEGIPAISASDTPIGTGGETLAIIGSLRGVSAVSASDTPIAGELTSRRSGSRLALSGTPALVAS
ncbi:MAG TPA: hypothetical protein VK552_19855, partial [Reyranella sp.]|nr:hypothetical protein [Reyranella sp.]